MSSEAQAADVAIQSALTGLIGAALEKDVAITGLKRIKGGYSREIWSFDAVASDRVHGLVLCTDSTDGAVQTGKESLSRMAEARLLRRLVDSGIPVPAVICFGEKGDAIGADYLVMERIDGETAVAPLIRDPYFVDRSAAITRQIAQVLCAIHHCPIPAEIAVATATDGGLIAREVARWRESYRTIPEALTPLVANAITWLESNIPSDPARLAIVHGDFRVGNIVYGPEGLRSILDWEMAHAGDPLEDVAWAQLVTWTGRKGALVESEQWVANYALETGGPVDAERLFFWDVLSLVKMTSLAYRAFTHANSDSERRFLRRLVEMLAQGLESHLNPPGAC